MLDAAESARLDELRRVAYGRTRQLTTAQAAELQELEQRRRVPAGEQIEGTQAEPEPRREPRTDAASPRHQSPPHEGEPAEIARPRGAKRYATLVIALAVVALIGVGIGWVIAPGADARPPLTDSAAEALATFEAEGGFDPGSVTYLGAQDGVSLWLATTSAGEQRCIMLAAGTQQTTQCQPAEQLPGLGPLAASLELVTAEGTRSVWGVVATDLQGRDVGLIQSQDSSSIDRDWQAQFTEDELAAANLLVDEGFEGSALSVVGYDDDLPVWLAYGAETCLAVVINGEVLTQCGSIGDGADTALELAVGGSLYSVRMSESHGPALTVTKQGGTGECAPQDGSTTRCTSIDDKTGQTGD